MSKKLIGQCKPEEFSDPMNLYIYAVNIIKGKLPQASHELMLDFQKKDPESPFVKGYFKFLEKGTLWSRFKRMIGVGS
jgi:hypothetical protein